MTDPLDLHGLKRAFARGGGACVAPTGVARALDGFREREEAKAP